MTLRGLFGETVVLTIAGYQYPDRHPLDDWYDANWLRVRIQVPDSPSWDSTDPALLTTEAKELARWLRLVAQRRAAEWTLEFIEPCLRFQITEDVAGDWQFQCDLSMGFVPKCLSALPGVSVRLLLDPDPEGLLLAADSLEREITPYPPRGEEGL